MSTAIPKLGTGSKQIDLFAEAVKANLDRLTGQHRNASPLSQLNSNATQLEIIEALNVLIARAGGQKPLSLSLIQSVAVALFLYKSIYGDSDDYYSNVVLLLHGNGTNGGTTFIDNSSKGKTLTANGNAQTSTAQKKFGNASMLFDGTGDYLTLPTSTDFDFDSGNFTIEAWVYTTTAALGENRVIFDRRGPSGLTDISYVFYYAPASSFISLDISANGTTVSSYMGSITLPLNQWVHVAAVRNETQIRLCVNGISELHAAPISGALFTSTSAVAVGGRSDGLRSWNGYIDELRVTKGVARYTTNYTPPSAQFYDGVNDPFLANTVLLLHANGTNGGTTFTDSSPSAKTMTANGSVTTSTTQVKFGSASIKLDTTTANKVTAAASADFAVGGGPFTIETFVYPTAYNGLSGGIASAGGGAAAFNSTNGWHWILFITDSTVAFQAWNGTGAVTLQSSVSLNTWAHWAVTYNGSVVTLWKDGVSVATATATVVAPSTTPTLAINDLIGVATGATNTFSGFIDDLRITKGVCRYTSTFLPPPAPFFDGANDIFWDSTVLALHMNGTNGSTTFTDQKGKTMTANGNAQISTAQSKFGGASALFDGTTDWISTPDASDLRMGTSPFTIEGWFNLLTLPAASGTMALVAKGAVATSNLEYRVVLFNSAGTYFIFYQDTTNGAALVTSLGASFALATGVWRHFAVTRDTTTARVFVDGLLLGSTASTTSQFASATPVNIGAEQSGISCVNGYIDDVRITKGVARYTSNFAIPTSAFPDL